MVLNIVGSIAPFVDVDRPGVQAPARIIQGGTHGHAVAIAEEISGIGHGPTETVPGEISRQFQGVAEIGTDPAARPKDDIGKPGPAGRAGVDGRSADDEIIHVVIVDVAGRGNGVSEVVPTQFADDTHRGNGGGIGLAVIDVDLALFGAAFVGKGRPDRPVGIAVIVHVAYPGHGKAELLLVHSSPLEIGFRRQLVSTQPHENRSVRAPVRRPGSPDQEFPFQIPTQILQFGHGGPEQSTPTSVFFRQVDGPPRRDDRDQEGTK